jgi:hypothetical protein
MFTSSSDMIRTLIRQALRWQKAAHQDQDVWVKMLHANYLLNTIDMIREIAGDEEVRNLTGVNMLELRSDAVKLQDSAQDKLVKLFLIKQ